jgi:hypothetical protein
MKEKNIKHIIADHLTKIPKKILSSSDFDILADCVLYEISKEICFHLSSVSYFVYNPDFHVCRGIAGILKEDLTNWCKDPWNNEKEFKEILHNTQFNKKIRETSFCTIKDQTIDTIGTEIKKIINNENLQFYSWKIKNNNIGILLYQKINISQCDENDIENGASLLGFCPII